MSYSGDYPMGCTQSIHDAYFDRDPNAEQAARERLAQEQYDAWASGDADPAVDEWMGEHLYEYAQSLLRGGDYRDAAMQRIERDCVGYLATWVDDEAITEAMEAPCA